MSVSETAIKPYESKEDADTSWQSLRLLCNIEPIPLRLYGPVETRILEWKSRDDDAKAKKEHDKKKMMLYMPDWGTFDLDPPFRRKTLKVPLREGVRVEESLKPVLRELAWRGAVIRSIEHAPVLPNSCTSWEQTGPFVSYSYVPPCMYIDYDEPAVPTLMSQAISPSGFIEVNYEKKDGTIVPLKVKMGPQSDHPSLEHINEAARSAGIPEEDIKVERQTGRDTENVRIILHASYRKKDGTLIPFAVCLDPHSHRKTDDAFKDAAVKAGVSEQEFDFDRVQQTIAIEVGGRDPEHLGSGKAAVAATEVESDE